MATIVRPEIETLPLASGETLIVKKRLNTGERREMLAMMRGPDGRFDGLISDRATLLAYLLDWTVKDQDGRPILIKGQDGIRQSHDDMAKTLDALDHEDYKEIEGVVNRYDEEITAKRRAEKKIQIEKAKGKEPSANDSPSASDGQAPSGTSSSTS